MRGKEQPLEGPWNGHHHGQDPFLCPHRSIETFLQGVWAHFRNKRYSLTEVVASNAGLRREAAFGRPPSFCQVQRGSLQSLLEEELQGRKNSWTSKKPLPPFPGGLSDAELRFLCRALEILFRTSLEGHLELTCQSSCPGFGDLTCSA